MKNSSSRIKNLQERAIIRKSLEKLSKRDKNARTSVSVLKSVPLGKRVIYPEQQEAAHEIMQILKLRTVIPTLCAQTQQGKTDAIIYLSHLFIQEQTKLNKKFHVFVLINISNNELRKDTENRFKEAGLIPNFCIPNHAISKVNTTVVHHGNIREVLPLAKKLKKQGANILLLVDESHIAQGSERPFDNFTQMLGIKWGQYVDEWTNDKVSAVSISATSFAEEVINRMKSIYSERDPSAFHNVILRVNPNYFSLEQMKKNDRINQVYPIVNKVKVKRRVTFEVSDFFKERVKEFKKICSTSENGYMMLRVRSAEIANKIHSYIYDKYGENLPLDIYDCSGLYKNIDEIKDDIKVKPSKPTIMIIKGALRAGETLPTTRYIRMWIDCNSNNADTTIQSIGRLTGYATDFDKDKAKLEGITIHSKFEDTFPVYCNTKEIDKTIEYYKDRSTNPIPSCINSKGTFTKNPGNHILLPFISTDKEESKKELEKLLKPIMAVIKKERNENGQDREFGNKPHITCTEITATLNDINDWCYRLENHQSCGNTDKISDKQIGVRIVKLDDIASKKDLGVELFNERKKSWDSLHAKYPQLKGKVVYAMPQKHYELIEKKNPSLLKAYKKNMIFPDTKPTYFEKGVKSSSTYANAL